MVASVYMRLKIELFAIAPTKSEPTTALGQAPGGVVFFRTFGVGMCRWDPGTLNLYQS